MAIVSQGNQGAGNLTLLDHVVSFPVSGANSATAEVTLSGTFSRGSVSRWLARAW